MKNPLAVLGVAWFAGVSLAAQAAEVRRLAAPDPEQGEWFGGAVAISGDRLLVGVTFDSERGQSSGSVHVFERDASRTWVHVTQLTASDEDEFDFFGRRVALDGDWALVTAPGDDAPVDNSGSAYAFERQPDGTWLERQKIAPGLLGEGFGAAIALQGGRAVVAAPFPSGRAGHAFVYERDASGRWNQVAELRASDYAGHNLFGESVALDGERVLVGADLDPELGFASGAAYAFERNAAGQWREVAKLHGSDSVRDDRFGYSVALSGDHALVGAFEADSLFINSGAVYAFEWRGAWTETAKIVPSDLELGDRFGDTLALRGLRALVGAQWDNDGPPFGSGQNAGSVYVYELDPLGAWHSTAKVLSSSPTFEGHFGYSLAFQGDEALIGATGENTTLLGSGAAFLFDTEPLSVDRTALSRSAGGARGWSQPLRQAMDLDAGPRHAGLEYLVLGSLSGTSPGLTLPGGLHLPLNPDSYFLYTLAPAHPPLVDSSGQLDAQGRAHASFELPGPIPPALIGRTFQHAFVVHAPGELRARFVSNAQPLRIGP